jgi:hypothetical protein
MSTTPSLCRTCGHMREIVSRKGSRFVLCTLSQTDARYAKYPPQPVAGCEGFSERDAIETTSQS